MVIKVKDIISLMQKDDLIVIGNGDPKRGYLYDDVVKGLPRTLRELPIKMIHVKTIYGNIVELVV